MTDAARRVLLVGASGQLGLALSEAFAGDALVCASHRHPAAGHVQLDLGDPASVSRTLDAVRPDLILIAGALCNVDLCEQEPDVCRRINTEGPAAIAAYASTHGARVVFYSTDHVFDGTKAIYGEADAVHPLNEYSRSKALAEAAVREALPDAHLIVRTSWVYGPDAQRRNFVLRLIDRLRDGVPVPVPADQWGSPTYTADIAAATRFLLERGATGTYHAIGPDFVTRAELAAIVCDEFGLDRHGVQPRTTAELGQAAPRPLRVRLDGGKLHAAGAPAFRPVRHGLHALATVSIP